MSARAHLAIASWLLGDLQRTRQLIKEAIDLGRESGHVPSAVFALYYKMIIEGLQHDLESVVADAENLSKVSQQHRMEYFVTFSSMYLSWARGLLGHARSRADELRRSLADYASQGNRLLMPWFGGFLAEPEASAGDAERALALIDEALATAQDSGQHITDAFLHRLRGDILLKRNAADTVPAERAYQTAIAIAKQQGARSYRLIASLALAKLYQSTARFADAHAALAPALQGFTPTPEMSEIAEAEALMERLA